MKWHVSNNVMKKQKIKQVYSNLCFIGSCFVWGGVLIHQTVSDRFFSYHLWLPRRTSQAVCYKDLRRKKEKKKTKNTDLRPPRRSTDRLYSAHCKYCSLRRSVLKLALTVTARTLLPSGAIPPPFLRWQPAKLNDRSRGALSGRHRTILVFNAT